MGTIIGGIVGVLITAIATILVNRGTSRTSVKVEQLRSGTAEAAQATEMLRLTMEELRAENVRVLARIKDLEARNELLEERERRRQKGGDSD